MFGLLVRLLSDTQIEKRYLKAGTSFGAAVSYVFMGECLGFRSLFKKWKRWEILYAQRGYRTLPVDSFCAWGGYGIPLAGVGVRREAGEREVLHASIYERDHLGRVKPVLDIGRLMSADASGSQEGTFILPSTKYAE